MNKIIHLSLIAVASLYAAEVELAPISVESTIITEVAENAQTSADLAQALSTKVPSIDMSRRSGIANDILIRGQKRDNISVTVDGTKVCGACVNRMDPPTSHILASQIDEIEVIEGPYDVENVGTLSGGIKVKTKQPTQKLQGQLNFGMGSWAYRKMGATVSGGNDLVRVLISASRETSDQYKDGNGDTIADQIDNYQEANSGTLTGKKDPRLQPKYHDMPAYTKQSVMAKAFVTVTEDQELRLSYTANRSDDVLYGNSKMDAIYDDSNIYSIAYDINNISDIYKNVNLEYYYSDVDHPMGTDYRMASNGTNPVMTNWLTTSMQGLKLKNNFDIANYKLLVGLDGSKRTWDGDYYANGAPHAGGRKSIDNALTNNAAIFAKLEKSYGALNITLGARYDDTKITNDSYQSNDYTGVGANILAAYNINKGNKVFFGIGQATRVPDARELYFLGSMGNLTGTPDLDQTTNQEIDLGYEANNDTFRFKVKAFYSMLKDYIYFNTNNKKSFTFPAPTGTVMLSYNSFENIDATIYGAELSASIYATDDITIDMGASYKKGEKDKAMNGQTDKDLADIAPLRGNIAANYEYMNNSIATLEVQASDKWSDIDSDNGEQELDAWTVVNAKVKHAVNKQFDFTVGVNNMFDEAYAASNTYADLILVTGGTSEVMLMNEPGRYFYTNLDFKF
ncbi:MAG: TonB-dependent receptor [Sulfurimonas sp.]|nr:TonB-dependent receptor [Sulfurimonas sp.]